MGERLHEYNTEKRLIDDFRGEYYFLSNFFPCKVTIEGITFQNSEAAFQAYKCPSRVKEFVNLSASDAKHLGRQVDLRPDWEVIKLEVMYQVLCAKFKGNKLLGSWLIQTGDAILVEGNTWGDRFWGVCGGKGKNHLGVLLMQVRDEIIREKINANI